MAGLLLTGLAVGTAGAEQFDCAEMAGRLNHGDHYQFKLELQSQQIRIEKGDDFCTEPAKQWFARKLILPRPARTEMPLPSSPPSAGAEPRRKDNSALPGSGGGAVPLPGQVMRRGALPDLGLDSGGGGATPIPTQRLQAPPADQATPADQAPPLAPGETPSTITQHSPEGVMQKGVKPLGAGDGADIGAPAGTDAGAPAGVAPPPPKSDPDLAKRCDREVTMFWAPGEHEIDGNKFWLAGVFTIDRDNDGRVDDVGFKIKTEGKIGNVLNYFPSTEGRLAGKTVETLRLEDDNDIRRLCPANLTFERPDTEEELKKQRAILQAQREAALAAELAKLKAAKEQAAAEAAAAAKAVAEAEAAAEKAKREAPPPTAAQGKTSKIVVGLAGAGVLFLILGGAGLFFVARNMRAMNEEEEVEEDEDEDEDA